MPYESSYIRDLALIQGITLLQNAIKRLDAQDKRSEEVSAKWIENDVPTIINQTRIIINTATNDITSKFLVKKLNKLNDELLSEFRHKPYIKRLSREALHAMHRAIQANAHIWNQAQLQSILTGLGSSHVVKTKGLPSYNIEKDEEKEEDKKKPHIIGK